jgi:DNA mismatch repair protein MutS
MACQYQAKLAAETNIPSLKVGYNKVFGYYIEVTESHREKAPRLDAQADRQKRRAVHHAGIEERSRMKPSAPATDRSPGATTLFEQVRQALLPHVPAFQELAYSSARLDVLTSWQCWRRNGVIAGRR